MDQELTPTSSQHVVLMMDHGQFYLRGADADPDELNLLERALAVQPNAGDGSTMVVLNPHQNNFEMPIDIEIFDARPPVDDENWQQVCEDRLEVDSRGVLQIDSTPAECIECRVLPGRYLVEVAGRGFVNYGWPGDTTPRDVWRIRMWPDDGIAPRPAVRWHMPGYGVPADTELPPEPDPEPTKDEPKWIQVFGSGQPPFRVDGEYGKRRTEERLRSQWGGEPISEVASFNGSQSLARFDHDLVLSIVSASESEARAIAVWCALEAADHAGLSSSSWARPVLDALEHDRPMPPPFGDTSRMGEAFAVLTTEQKASADAGKAPEVRSVAVEFTVSQDNPYDGPRDARYAAIPAFFSARDADALRAAMETLHHASHAFGSQVTDLHNRLKEKFFSAPSCG